MGQKPNIIERVANIPRPIIPAILGIAVFVIAQPPQLNYQKLKMLGIIIVVIAVYYYMLKSKNDK